MANKLRNVLLLFLCVLVCKYVCAVLCVCTRVIWSSTTVRYLSRILCLRILIFLQQMFTFHFNDLKEKPERFVVQTNNFVFPQFLHFSRFSNLLGFHACYFIFIFLLSFFLTHAFAFLIHSFPGHASVCSRSHPFTRSCCSDHIRARALQIKFRADNKTKCCANALQVEWRCQTSPVSYGYKVFSIRPGHTQERKIIHIHRIWESTLLFPGKWVCVFHLFLVTFFFIFISFCFAFIFLFIRSLVLTWINFLMPAAWIYCCISMAAHDILPYTKLENKTTK